MNTTTNQAAIQYIGEHLLPGQIGYVLTIVSLVASLLATFAFAKAFFSKELTIQYDWKKLAYIAFIIEAICVFSCFVILFYVIYNHLFEYKYAYLHSNTEMPVQYLLSCFWEGQEGSFLLWSFWHCVLGLIIMFKSKKWKHDSYGVMMVLSFVQFCLATMVVGLYFFNFKLGSSPFNLLRNEMNLPIFSIPDYLTNPKIRFQQSAQGLNTLLQNYWMVIHPPILFLGFASTSIPFAFVVTGLFKKDHKVIDNIMPWANFSAGILGLGIMMGAAWAYESLTFGGYWAWDPVENASLVPWLALVAAIHAVMIFRKTGSAAKVTYLFFGISFLLVVYSTFLTRSGILGDTSVHAFTDLGMNTQLLAFLLIFVIPFFVLFFVRYKFMADPPKEDAIDSREFWMLVGSLVLFLSAMVIIANTSIPVYNKIFGTKNAPSEDVAFDYNKIQVFVAIIIGILSGVGQFLAYKGKSVKGGFWKTMSIPLIITAVITAVLLYFENLTYTEKGAGYLSALYLATVTSVFTVVANAHYWLVILKRKMKSAGASIGHIGFGMVLVGILISSSNKKVLSENTTGISFLQKDGNKKNPVGDPKENLTLFQGITTDMYKDELTGKYNYKVTYVRDTVDALKKKFFELKFVSKSNGETKDSFYLYPDVLKSNKGMDGFSANPASKHYWNKDIFVYVTSFQDHSKDNLEEFKPNNIKVGDSVFYGNGYIVLDTVLKKANQLNNDSLSEAIFKMTVHSKEGITYTANPSIRAKGMEISFIPDTVRAQNLVLKLNGIANTEKGIFILGVKESTSLTNFITLKVYEFPLINLLWLGVIVMTFGFGLSTYARVKQLKSK
jgi:cytochrome c-type biogenesis protein CcmF